MSSHPAPQSEPDAVPSAPSPSYSVSHLYTSITEPLHPYTPHDTPLQTCEKKTYWTRHADFAACDAGSAERRLEETFSMVAYSGREYDYLVDEYNMMFRRANRDDVKALDLERCEDARREQKYGLSGDVEGASRLSRRHERAIDDRDAALTKQAAMERRSREAEKGPDAARKGKDLEKEKTTA